MASWNWQQFLTGLLKRIGKRPFFAAGLRQRPCMERSPTFLLERLEDRRLLANIAINSAYLVDGNFSPVSSVVGERIIVRVNYTTNTLLANASYRISYVVDGVALSFDNVMSGAGLSSGSWSWARAGWFNEATGVHNVSVTVEIRKRIVVASL